MAKMFEDALCALEILKDDSPQYVARTILEVARDGGAKISKAGGEVGEEEFEKGRDRLIITIKPYEPA